MKIFPRDRLQNLLPYEGETYYHGPILEAIEAQNYFDQLIRHVPWQHDQLQIYGKTIITKRKVAWYGDPGLEYTYSHTTKLALPWTDELLLLKKRIEFVTGRHFNSCLLNLYDNGSQGMAWHRDDEKELGKFPCIASLSLGAERKFSLKHNSGSKKIDLILENGSLLVMQGSSQKNWKHSLPKSKKISQPRINLTFRQIQK